MRFRQHARARCSLLHKSASTAPFILCLLVVQIPCQTSLAAERTVLCEEFTDIFCIGCSHAGPALSRLVDVYDGSFAFIQHHPTDEYSTAWSANRWSFYSAQYTPTAVFDGTDILAGSVVDSDQQYTIYRANHFLPQRAVPTDVTISISAQHLTGQTYRVSTNFGIEPAGQGKTMRLYLVQVLDHWPASPTYSRNTFKQAAPTKDITLAPGESHVREYDFTFDADSWANTSGIRIIAWAQAPVATGPATVYQAATRDWPLISAPNDADGDGAYDWEDNCPDRYNPLQADADNDGVGDACDNCASASNSDQADHDEDSVGDVCDNCPMLHHVIQADTDTDGIGDVCDSCPDLGAPAGVDAFGRPLGGIDVDCDVDLDDVALFTECIDGPISSTPPPACSPENFGRADTDHDTDVDLLDFSNLTINFTGPLVSPALYVGASSCTECHVENHTSWLSTIHATAFDTLIADGAGDNELCFPCHTVGYGKASGFVDLQTTPQLADVQCENCHGPGSNHVSDPDNQHLQINMDSTLCGACHQSCHGLCGENHHPQYEQWSTTNHSQSLWNIMFEPDYSADCLRCHSTDYRLAPADNKPGMWEVSFNVECVGCHDPHGSANVGQLRLPPMQLCADCHTMEQAAPPDEPAQPQSEMLHSLGGLTLEGSPLAGPHSAHWWGIGDECAVCHVHEEPYGGPDQPVDSGHTFLANMRACEPCHSEQTATMLVASLAEELNFRLATVAHYVTPGDPLYVDPSTLDPTELARYRIAKFDYQLVVADKSIGAHNAPYARALLSETEEFFDIPPWLYLMFTEATDPLGGRNSPTIQLDEGDRRP